LAVTHRVDPDRAELAAFLHDIADHHTDGHLVALAGRFEIPISATESRVPRLLHAPVGAAILRQEYGIRDDELLDAVRQHTVGSPFMGPLAKALFVANQCDPGRDHLLPGSATARRGAGQSLDQAMLALCDGRIRDLLDAGQSVHEGLFSTRNVLIERVRTGRHL
jgi:predicted HD superfamily hydrolase involved in NAD metabolism